MNRLRALQSLELQVAVPPAELVSVCSVMAQLEEYFEVVQRQVADHQSASLAVQGEHSKYRSRPGMQAPPYGVLEELLCIHRSRLEDHFGSTDSVWDLIRQDMDHDLDDIFADYLDCGTQL